MRISAASAFVVFQPAAFNLECDRSICQSRHDSASSGTEAQARPASFTHLLYCC